DFVEGRLALGRHAVELVDTAGVRESTADEVEAAGISLSRAQLEGADLVLWLVAPDEDLSEQAGEFETRAREAIGGGGGGGGEGHERPAMELWVVASQRDRIEGLPGGRSAGSFSGSVVEAKRVRVPRYELSIHDAASVERLRDALELWASGG